MSYANREQWACWTPDLFTTWALLYFQGIKKCTDWFLFPLQMAFICKGCDCKHKLGGFPNEQCVLWTEVLKIHGVVRSWLGNLSEGSLMPQRAFNPSVPCCLSSDNDPLNKQHPRKRGSKWDNARRESETILFHKYSRLTSQTLMPRRTPANYKCEWEVLEK